MSKMNDIIMILICYAINYIYIVKLFWWSDDYIVLMKYLQDRYWCSWEIQFLMSNTWDKQEENVQDLQWRL